MNFIVFSLGYLMLTFPCDGSIEEIVGEFQQELQQLKMKTDSYERELQSLRISSANEIQALQNSVASYVNEIQKFKLKTSSCEIKIHILEDSVISAANEIQALKTSTANEIQDLKTSSANEITSLKQLINDLKDEKCDGGEVKRRFILGTNSYAEKPSFSASLSSSTNLTNHQTIVFDSIFTNDLGGYSGLTGVFKAPVNGTYFFTATVMSIDDELLAAEICMNGNTVVATYSYDAQRDQGSNSVVLVLMSGDEVWVRNRYINGSKAYGNHYSTFSGFMISY